MVKLGSENLKSEDEVQGSTKPLAGRYHSVINEVQYLVKDAKGKLVEVEEDDEIAEKIKITFEVLAGTVPAQAERTIEEYFALTDKAISRLQRLALCIGLLRPGEAEKEVRFSQAVGKQLVIEIEDNEYVNKASTKVQSVRVSYMGMWSVGNEAVKDVPKDEESLKLLPGASVSASRQSPTQQVAPQQPAQQPQQTASATAGGNGNDKWGGL